MNFKLDQVYYLSHVIPTHGCHYYVGAHSLELPNVCVYNHLSFYGRGHDCFGDAVVGGVYVKKENAICYRVCDYFQEIVYPTEK